MKSFISINSAPQTTSFHILTPDSKTDLTRKLYILVDPENHIEQVIKLTVTYGEMNEIIYAEKLDKMNTLFKNIISDDCKDNEFYEQLGTFLYQMTKLMFLTRGTAAVNGWIGRAIAQAKGITIDNIHVNHLPFDIFAECELDEKKYVKKFIDAMSTSNPISKNENDIKQRVITTKHDNKKFIYQYFSDIKLLSSKVTDCKFEECDFNHCYFVHTNFNKSVFYGLIKFNNCKFDHVNFSNVYFHNQVEFINCQFNACTFDNASFTHWKFGQLNFSGASFKNTDFNRSDFNGTNLTGSDLSGAFLTSTNLIGAILTNVNFSGAKFFKMPIDGDTFELITDHAAITHFMEHDFTSFKKNLDGFQHDEQLVKTLKECGVRNLIEIAQKYSHEGYDQVAIQLLETMMKEKCFSSENNTFMLFSTQSLTALQLFEKTVEEIKNKKNAPSPDQFHSKSH